MLPSGMPASVGFDSHFGRRWSILRHPEPVPWLRPQTRWNWISPRRSLVSICLPDETRLLADETPAALHPNNQPELPLPLPSAVAAHYPRPHIALIDYINRVPIPGIRRVKPDPEMRRLIAPNPPFSPPSTTA